MWAPGTNHHTDSLVCMTKLKATLRLGKHRPPGSYPPSSRGLHGHSPLEPRPKEGGADKSTARNFFARGEAWGSSVPESRSPDRIKRCCWVRARSPFQPRPPDPGESSVGGSHAGPMPGPCHVRRAHETAAGSLRLRLDERSSGTQRDSGRS